MLDIAIDQVELARFKSFAEPTVITLSPGPGLKYISGVNEVEPELGSNGAGKTTQFDAITWCFYGTSIRGARAALLINGKQTEVTVRLTINDVQHEVSRSAPPDRLMINGELVEQGAVDALLGTSKGQFLQSVIFGQGVPTFYDMTVPERGVLFDDVLKLGLWLRASDAAGKQAQAFGRELDQAAKQLAYAEGVSAALADERLLADQEAAWNREHSDRINTLIDEMAALETQQAARTAAIKRTNAALRKLPDEQSLVDAVDAVREHISESVMQLRQLTDKAVEAKRQRVFYRQNQMCPVCKQKIDTRFADSCLIELDKTIERVGQDTLKADSTGQALRVEAQSRVSALENARIRRSEFHKLVDQTTAALDAEQRSIGRLEQQIKQAIDTVNPYTDQLHALRDSKQQAGDAVRAAKAAAVKLEGQLIEVEWWRTGFKRVRLFQLKRVLDALQLETNTIAQSLGLVGWQISYSTEVETKSGALSSRPGVYISIVASGDDSAREWSPGEMQRVRLAVASGFAALIQASAAVRWNLLVLDEPTHWLSQQGIDSLLDYLQQRAALLRKSIWLIDHRSLNETNFAEIWRVTKSVDSSHIELLSKSS